MNPLVIDARLGYVRLRKSEYDGAEIAGCLERIERAGWEQTYVFFLHEDAARGPR